jgi:[histone H3]-lysine4/36 N-trimethyltransferase SMYD
MFKQIEDGKFGKSLISTKNISIGELVLKEKPQCHVVTDKLITTHCQTCLKFLTKKFRCNQCKYLYYCSPKCQKEDWNEHKYECKSILKISPNQPTESIRLMSRILEKKRNDEKFYSNFQKLISRLIFLAF